MSIIIRLLRSSIVAVFTLLYSVVASAEPAPRINRVQLEPDLRPNVERMLQSSPTFRQQFRRLTAAPALLLGVRVDPRLTQRSYRAYTRIRRFDSGLIVATVTIGPGTDQAQWIAHEFEHVIEQLDGWKLPALIDRGQQEAWYTDGDMIETRRAMRAGRMVFDEIRRHLSDKLVE